MKEKDSNSSPLVNLWRHSEAYSPIPFFLLNVIVCPMNQFLSTRTESETVEMRTNNRFSREKKTWIYVIVATVISFYIFKKICQFLTDFVSYINLHLCLQLIRRNLSCFYKKVIDTSDRETQGIWTCTE